ncbi:MAG TPA: hypothetical protein VK540_05930 [Polyangiaceae bacterium]|jgi:hypothetical protein|nr:hypothetical protein [Polyangiaceae bacterium]
MRRVAERWAGTAVLLFLARAAAAQVALPGDEPTDPYALPDAPAPPTLPDLTHRALAASLENTFASIQNAAPPGQAQLGRTFGWMERLEVEQALSIRRWYVGVAEQVALGNPLNEGFQMVAGNPEVWGRTLWASQAGLAYGGGLGAVLPAFRRSAGSSTLTQTVAVVRPWDYADFVNGDFILRPFFDVRGIDGRVMLQLRQGIDWDQASGALTSRTTFYIGYRPVELFGLGLEAWEIYLIQAAQRKDDGRAAYAVSASVRLMTRVLTPAVSIVAPIARPLYDAVEAFWAIRLTMSVILEPSASASAVGSTR